MFNDIHKSRIALANEILTEKKELVVYLTISASLGVQNTHLE